METIKIYEKDDIRDIFLIERKGEVEIFYKDDKPFNGKLEIYGYEDKLKLKGELRGGLRSMTWTHYYANGQEEIIEHYLSGKRNGKYEMFYEDGTLKLTGYNIEEKEDGHWKWYREDGTIEGEADYVEGEIKGIWKLYYPNGNIERQTKTLSDGYTEILKSYDENKNLIFEGHMYNGRKHGKYKRYYDTGELKEEGEYRYGLLENEVKTYDKNGNLKYITTYSKDKVTKIEDLSKKITENKEKLSYEDNSISKEKKIDTNVFSKIESIYLKKLGLKEIINKKEAEEFLRKIPDSEKIDILNKIERYLNVNEIGQIEFDTGSVWTGKDVFLFFKEGMEL
ncbi:hypothetical protein [Leptotrichia massiliensis]|uniref:toxin-antitoxin system YwqK family antitoxin n=1 Tax=Leptotrichia massiliensis TaxID=1852388 RepID=UPI0028EC9B60|nr:hypothetical protein [Leptotrichia massiliensis]